MPELQKKTASRCGGVRFVRRLGQQPAEERAIHLHHVGQIEIEHVADRFLHRGMVAPDIEDAVAAQEIEIGGVIHVVEIRALGPRIDLVETDDALRGDEGAVEVPLVQFVVFAEAGRDELFEIKCHAEWSAIWGRKRKPTVSSRDRR